MGSTGNHLSGVEEAKAVNLSFLALVSTVIIYLRFSPSGRVGSVIPGPPGSR